MRVHVNVIIYYIGIHDHTFEFYCMYYDLLIYYNLLEIRDYFFLFIYRLCIYALLKR